MDFDLSDDQLALADAAGALLSKRASPELVRKVVDAGGGYDEALWHDMVEQGWPAVAVPESLGGLGLGWVEAAVLLEQVGAHLAPAPILQHVVALDAVARAALAGIDTAAEWLDPLVAGRAIATVAGGSVVARHATGWLLDGTTEPVVFAPSADVVVVAAEVPDGGRALFLVDLRSGRPRREPAMDRTREVGWIHFEGRPAHRIGDAADVEAFLDRGAIAYSAELLGVSAKALDLAVAYAKDRVQFGRPIGSFQAVKHRCADMLVDVEGMRSAALYAAWCASVDDDDTSIAASTAKTWCTDASRRVLASTLQVHGGIGFTWESDVHLYLKRGQLDQVSFGDARFHRTRLAAMLRGRVEAGQSVI